MSTRPGQTADPGAQSKDKGHGMCYSCQKGRNSVQLWASIRETHVEGHLTKKPVNLLQNKYQDYGRPEQALTLLQPVQTKRR